MDVEDGDGDLSDLSDLPFDVLRQLQEKFGLKRFQQYLNSKESAVPSKHAGKKVASKFLANDEVSEPKALIKGQPIEISSKRKQRKPRQVIIGQARSRDPRFETQSGNFNEDLFEKSYAFLDDTRSQEITKIKKGNVLTSTEIERFYYALGFVSVGSL